jgi:hypothetical protein
MVEVLALGSLELSLDKLVAVGHVDLESQQLIQEVKIIVPPSGATAELEFPSDEVREQLLYAFAELEELSAAREQKGLRDEQESDLAEDEEIGEELIDEQVAKEAEREAQNDERQIEFSAATEAKLAPEDSNEHNGHSCKAAAEMESEEVDGEVDSYPQEIEETTAPLPTYERIAAVYPENQDFLNYKLDLHSQFSLQVSVPEWVTCPVLTIRPALTANNAAHRHTHPRSCSQQSGNITIDIHLPARSS